MKLKTFIREIEKEAPLNLAENWDNPGLQVGNPEREINRILVALQLNKEILQEAIEKKIDLIFTHHPLIFRPMKAITFHDYNGYIISQLIKHNIALYAAHTNLDSSPHGINEQIIRQFPIIKSGILKKEKTVTYKKISVYYPSENENKDKFIEGVLERGNTYLGEYTKCGFYSAGTGCFEPTSSANPNIGEKNSFNQVNEFKLEFIIAPENYHNTISYIRKNHPYEEPLIIGENINYPIITEYGIGRWGELDKEYDWPEFLKLLQKIFAQKNIRYKKINDKKIKKIGLVGGVGIFYINGAVAKNCDLYLTSDIKHHEWDLADINNINLAEITHFKMESLGLKKFFDYFKDSLLKYAENLEVIYSELEKENFSQF